MNRRGFLGLVTAAIAAPFLPKPAPPRPQLTIQKLAFRRDAFSAVMADLETVEAMRERYVRPAAVHLARQSDEQLLMIATGGRGYVWKP